jgi:hypothetical protein
MGRKTTAYLAYVCASPSTISDSLPDGYELKIWVPRFVHFVAPTLGFISVIWSVFHFCRIFTNGHFRVVYIYQGNKIVHRSCVFPPHFRLPFMSENDLQIGATWTEPAFRGKGLQRPGQYHENHGR